MQIHPLIDPYAIHYSGFAGDVYTLDAASITLTAGTITAAAAVLTTADINGGTWQGTIDGTWSAAGQTCTNLGSVTTADINGGTVDGITSLTAAGNLDIGSYTLRASGLYADSITATKVLYTGTNGLLTGSNALYFTSGTSTLTATNIVADSLTMADNYKITLGDASAKGEIYYNGTSLAIDPDAAGTGDLRVFGGLTVRTDSTYDVTVVNATGQLTATRAKFAHAITGAGDAPLITQNQTAFASPWTMFNFVWLDSSGSVMGFIRNDGAIYMYGTSGYIYPKGIGHSSGASTVIPITSPVKIDTNTTHGQPALYLQQDDADQQFIEYDGTSAANTSNNITSWTTGNSIQGFVRISVEGSDYWMPFYDAPTS